MMMKTYANPTKRRKTTTKKRRSTKRRSTTRRRTYATRRNPVTKVNFMEMGKQVGAGAVGAVGVGAAAVQLAEKVLKKPGTPVQGFVAVGLSFGLMYLGKTQKQPLLTAAGQGAAGFASLYLAKKITESKDTHQSPLSNVLAGSPQLAGDPEMWEEDNEPSIDSGVFAGFNEPTGLNSGVFNK